MVLNFIFAFKKTPKPDGVEALGIYNKESLDKTRLPCNGSPVTRVRLRLKSEIESN